MFIHIGQEGVDCLRDRVSTAESPHHARFFQRISLFFHVPAYNRLLPFGYRPLRCIVPIRVFSQNRIRIEQVACDLPEHEFSIRRSGRPIHQPAWLIGGIIEKFNPDLFCNFSGDGTVLIRCHLTGQRDDETKPWLFRCVLMGGVYIALEGKEHFNLINDIFCRIIHIQRQARPGKDTILLPAAAF